jgi:hypothetical protein
MYSNSFVSYSSRDNSTNPEFIYYDITVGSKRTEETGIVDPPVVFSETRSQPLISDSSLYNMSIIRFSMDGCGSDLPMWIPTIEPNQTADLNKTIYVVSVQVGNRIGSANLEWTTEINGANPSTSKYYYCYTYSHFCDIFNAAVLYAVNTIDDTVKAPRLVYNGATNLFSLYCDMSVWGTTWKLFFDANLYQLLRNFNNMYYPTVTPLTNEILITNNINNVITGDDGVKYIVTTQDYPSTDAIWSPISSIVFTTSMLPIIAEQVAVPIVFSDGNVSNSGTSQANYQNTITDISLALNRSSDYKGFVEYAPNPYRMISLAPTKQEIRQIDISVYFKTRLGALIPVTLPNGSSISMKLMFRLKSLGI